MASFTAGGFTLSGFDASSTASGASDFQYGSGDPGTFFTIAPAGGDPNTFAGQNYLWNWGGAGGANAVASSSTGDAWSLTITLQTLNAGSLNSEELWTNPGGAPPSPVDGVAGDGGTSGDGGISSTGTDSTGVTLTGTGSNDLLTQLHNLAVNLGGWFPGGVDNFSVTFNFTDTTTSASTEFTQYFTTSATACFTTGTRIAIPSGETAVEDLRIGDLVLTASGQAKPIKWIGRRTYPAATAAANPHVRSVLVRKDAIAPGMPHRDLSISAMHALFIDDVFVPAAALINGVTILRNDEVAPVSYVHIEMDSHDVVFADGAPTETYVDDNSRLMFDNADEYYEMYGADQGTQTFSAPRIEEGVQLEAIRRRIAARAGVEAPVAGTGKLRGNVERLEDGVLHGWVMDTTSTAPVELELLADGEVVGTAVANRYRADLDFHGIAGGRAGFTFAMPASVTSLDQVTVRRAGDRKVVPQPKVAATV